MKTIYFTVTNDLNFDQRMMRICTSLSNKGYRVVLIGRKKPDSPTCTQQPYEQLRIRCLFNKGLLFYAEYNFRLFWLLLFKKMDVVCAIDLDTILPCLLVSIIRNKKRVFDAHELFCEMKEVVSRKWVFKTWKLLERLTVPRFRHGYTVNQPLADAYEKMYQIRLSVIRNMPWRTSLSTDTIAEREDFILYQGAVNEGRCFETLIPAMKEVDCTLIVCGEGNFMQQARQITSALDLEKKIIFKGMIAPEQLKSYTVKAKIGLTLFEKESNNNYLSLANRYFDYIQACTPQLAMNYPAYRELNQIHHTGVLIDDTSSKSIAEGLNLLLNDKKLWQDLHNNCNKAAKEFCWEKEEIKLISFYQQLIG